MFERFTEDARDVVIGAQVEARALRHSTIGTEHLLLGLLADAGSAGGAVLHDQGMTVAGIRAELRRRDGDPSAAAAALETIGIDLDQVRSAVEASFGEGALERAGRWRRTRKPGDRRGGRGQRGRHIPFTAGAKKALELSLREALRRKERTIGSEHILLGLLREGQGAGAALLTDRGIDAHVIESVLAEQRRRAS